MSSPPGLLCEVCGDDLPPRPGGALSAHLGGIHHRANVTLTQRAVDRWCPLTPTLAAVVLARGLSCVEDGRYSDMHERWRRVRIVPLIFALVDEVESLVECPLDAAMAFAVRSGWGAWTVEATRLVTRGIPWWVAVRETDPSARHLRGVDTGERANRPVNVLVRGRPFPRAWSQAATGQASAMQGALELGGGRG